MGGVAVGDLLVVGWVVGEADPVELAVELAVGLAVELADGEAVEDALGQLLGNPGIGSGGGEQLAVGLAEAEAEGEVDELAVAVELAEGLVPPTEQIADNGSGSGHDVSAVVAGADLGAAAASGRGLDPAA